MFKSHQRVTFGGTSLTGVRAENQDAFIVKHPQKQDELTFKGTVVCIADGVSCSDQGQQASHTITTQFVQDYYATPHSWSVSHSVTSLLSQLNQWLYTQGQDALRHNGMVTTLSSLILKSNTAHLIHIGDSRIYRYRRHKLTQLTRDHQRTTAKGMGHLTRALGMDENADVDYQTLEVNLHDRFLLTTDGVHQTLSPEQISTVLAQQDSAEALSAKLCQLAIDNGSQDNCTCVIFDIMALPEKSLPELEQQLLSRRIPPALKARMSLDHFKVLRTLHDGSRSHVYLVEDTHTREQRVLKAPSGNASDDLPTLRRFANEYWIASQLNNPRIMKMYAPPAETPFLYQISEWIPGTTLRQWIFDHPNPSLNEVRTLLTELVRAVRVLQRADMVHCDLKPENIMITPEGTVKLIDFGTVDVLGLREAQAHQDDPFPLGTVNYIAPEYINTGRATTLSDLFSIAVIGYEMLSGSLPFKENTSQAIQSARHTKWHYQSLQTHRADIPLWVDLAFRKATEESPLQRYQALGDFVTDLSTPNSALINSPSNRPLMTRNPVLFWKMISLAALFVAIVEGLLLINR